MSFEVYEGEQQARQLLTAGKSFFLTGKAGTGKSTLLRTILANDAKNETIVLAPTGLAALNVGGQTIHSFFKLPLRIILPNDKHIIRFRKNSEQALIIEKIKTLIIDEVSMVRPDILDCIDHSLKLNKRNQLPFGGVQIILVGDLFQIPPVSNRNEFFEEDYKSLYQTNFFFSAHSFNSKHFSIVQLLKVYRQKDRFFGELLNKLRYKKDLAYIIEEFNKYYFDDETQKKKNSIILAPRNKTVDNINQSHLDNIESKLINFNADIEGDYVHNKYPTKEILGLKVGAQVIFIRNDPEGRWVNGSLGKVNEINKECVTVEMENGNIVEVKQITWENNLYSYNLEKQRVDKSIMGTFTQLPLKLAWAMTIHKSQGLTFNNLILDLEGGTFVGGQCYVAMSRLTRIEGLRLSRPLRPSDIRTDPAVISFYMENNLK